VVEKELKGAPFEKKLVTKTYEDINLNPIYTKANLADSQLVKELPGFQNYLRGTSASNYLKRSWDISQELPYALAKDFNEALIHDLEQGQTSINILLDKVTKLGIDADYGQVGEVGKGGISLSALRSISNALNGIDLNKYPIFVEAGFSALPFLILFNAYLENEGIEIKNVKGSIESDPLGYLCIEGSLPVSEDLVFAEMKTAAEWMINNNSGIRTIGVSGIPYHNAGASAVQELAFALATGVEYFNQMVDRKLSPNNIAESFRFTFGIGSFYFMEIAKLRAARLLWNKITNEYKVDEKFRKMIIHGRTSSYNQTEYDPYVNMLRTTTEAFSAIVGGVDSLHTNHFDEVYGLPNGFSRRISKNTQIILKEESHLNGLIDPAGGSYYVETLTAEVAKKAFKLFQEIEKKGGMLKALKEGFPQREIEKVTDMRKKDLKKRKSVLVGTNMYSNIKEEKLESRIPDYEDVYNKRAEYLQNFRISAENDRDGLIMEKLQSLADSRYEDIIKTGIEAILAGATIGEISKSIRAVSGEEVEIEPLKIERVAVIFEELRNASESYKKKTGERPKIFLANMGTVKQYKGRADFSRGFFEVGGFEVIYPSGFQITDEAISAATESSSNIIVICSTDDAYPELVPSLVKGIKERKTNSTLILAGYPKDQIEVHKKSGIDEFIFLGCDAYKILSGLLQNIGAM
jgi:methylmalonyl-CoA mutase